MNLLLVNQAVENQCDVLPEVVREINALGNVRARLVYDVAPRLKHFLWTLGRPTAVVSFRPIKKFRPSCARIFEPQALDKFEELTRLQNAGIRIPKWTSFLEGEQPDLADFHEYVVVKPALGARGALVRMMKKNRVTWRPLEVRDLGISRRLIVQEYIHTGTWPHCYRVGTIFGEPYYKFHVTADQSRAPIDTQFSTRNRSQTTNSSLDTCHQGFAGKTIVASSKGCTFDEEVPQAVIETACRAHRLAFPEIPLLGIDLIVEESTGHIYVLEVNAIGGTFVFTSDVGKSLTEHFGFHLRNQFGGAKAIAKGLHEFFVQDHQSKEAVCSRR